MRTETIRQMITKAVKNEKSTNNLAKLAMSVARNNGKQMSLADAKGIRNFVIEYVKQVPLFIEEGLNMARQFGIQNEMNQMIGELEQYWILEDDLIPDNLGLIGITDDAYASMFLLQSISDYCQSMFNHPLIKVNFTESNKLIRNLLGESIAAALEQKVSLTIANNMVNQVFNQVYKNIFSSGFTFGNAAQAYLEQREIEQQVNVQLGAMGIL